MVNYIGKNMNKNELIDNIIDAAWIIKTKYPSKLTVWYIIVIG